MADSGASFSILDASDAGQVAEYEYHFYRAYARLSDNKLVRLIWDWDDQNQRLRARIPYASQVIYCLRDERGSLAGAMAVNLAPAVAFQSAEFGFTPAHPTDGPSGLSCEIINLMATTHARGPARSAYQAFIRDYGYADLVARGFDTAFSTCTRRRLRAYQLFGATALGETVINGEARYFLHWPIRDLLTSDPCSNARTLLPA
jgi:hypothetical protein